jgi:ammonium transporter, Amt family
MAWIIASTALVWLMIPGVGFFYSGLLRRKNALSMIWASMMTLAVVSFEVSFPELLSDFVSQINCTLI